MPKQIKEEFSRPQRRPAPCALRAAAVVAGLTEPGTPRHPSCPRLGRSRDSSVVAALLNPQRDLHLPRPHRPHGPRQIARLPLQHIDVKHPRIILDPPLKVEALLRGPHPLRVALPVVEDKLARPHPIGVFRADGIPPHPAGRPHPFLKPRGRAGGL
jgi:hypothetical protein